MGGNGVNGSMKVLAFVGSILGGFIGIIAIIHTTVYSPITKALADEIVKREVADVNMQKDIRDAIDKQQKTNQETAVVMAKILTKLETIEKAVR